MEHSFDIEIAQQVGVQAAILYKHIKFWCSKNKANDVHFHDGYYWTYNSKKAFAELFPYMTERQIDYALTKLLNAGLIIKGNYNTSAYDKTLWYADVCLLDNTKLCNRDTEIVKPIPDSKQHIVNNNDILSKDNISSENSADTFQFGETKQGKPNLYQKCIVLIDDWTNIDSINTLLKQYLDLCMEMKSIRGANQWKGMLNTLERVQKECHPHTFEEIIRMSIEHGWKTFYPIKDTSYNNKSGGKNLEGFKSPDINNDGLNHTKSEREF